MDISAYVNEYARKKKYYDLPFDTETVHNLIKGEKDFAFIMQEGYANSEYLAYNIKTSVRAYPRDKDVAIRIYKDFLKFLKGKGVDETVEFPPIAISNSFERLMFIAKYLHDPRHKIAELEERVWVSPVTIRSDLRKLQGEDGDPIQICGKAFRIADVEKQHGSLHFSSTAHPLFLTPNLTQVIVTLKGLKSLAANPLYAEYAYATATDIWEQLSDYAKMRICFVLSELLPEDLTWYQSLKKKDSEVFYSEVRCSSKNNILDCIKNDKSFFVEYQIGAETHIFKQCRFVPQSYREGSIEVDSTEGRMRLFFDCVIKTAYTVEELL